MVKVGWYICCISCAGAVVLDHRYPIPLFQDPSSGASSSTDLSGLQRPRGFSGQDVSTARAPRLQGGQFGESAAGYHQVFHRLWRGAQRGHLPDVRLPQRLRQGRRQAERRRPQEPRQEPHHPTWNLAVDLVRQLRRWGVGVIGKVTKLLVCNIYILLLNYIFLFFYL